MIQTYVGDKLLLGITRANITELLAGRPILVSLPMHKAGLTQIAVFFGETKAELVRLMAEAGIELPQAMVDVALKNPL